jgi:hypothetical protein
MRFRVALLLPKPELRETIQYLLDRFNAQKTRPLANQIRLFGMTNHPPDRLPEQPASFEQIQDSLSAGKIRHPRISGRSGRQGDGAGL